MDRNQERQEQTCFKILSVVYKQVQRDFDTQLQTELVYYCTLKMEIFGFFSSMFLRNPVARALITLSIVPETNEFVTCAQKPKLILKTNYQNEIIMII